MSQEDYRNEGRREPPSHANHGGKRLAPSSRPSSRPSNLPASRSSSDPEHQTQPRPRKKRKRLGSWGILIYVVCVLGASVLLAGVSWMWANDILALKEADCAISVAAGSEAARNVSHLVLTDNNFLSLPDVVYEGRRVINNIKSSASLYLMKTLFTVFVAVFCFFLRSQYFFTTNNMLLFETMVTALPSMVLALQPNGERVKGKFIPFVLARAIPGAVTLFLCVLAVYAGVQLFPAEFGGLNIPIDQGNGAVKDYINPMFVLAVSFGGLVMLSHILKPFNWLRASVYVVSVGVSILVLCVPVLGDLIYTGWSTVQLDLTQWLYLCCIILAAFPVSGWLVRLGDFLSPND